MPTVVTKTVAATSSPTTPDYSTWQAAEDAITADLVAADEQWDIKGLNQGEFTAAGDRMQCAGQTTDATRFIRFMCGAGASFQDNAGVRSNALVYNASNGVGVRRSEPYQALWRIDTHRVQVIGIQLSQTGNDRPLLWNGQNGTLDSCIVKTTGGSLSGLMGAGTKFVNSLIHGRGIQCDASGGDAFIHGCTIIGPGSGNGVVATYSGNLVVKNTAIFNFGTVESGTVDATSNYNATDGASITGANSLNSLTFADQFENSTNDFRAASTGDLQAGTPDATNLPDDITGLDRDDTTPWIGAWEVESQEQRFWLFGGRAA